MAIECIEIDENGYALMRRITKQLCIESMWSDNREMDAKTKVVETFHGQPNLIGLKVSAGLLYALGGLWGLYTALSAVLIGVMGMRAWKGRVYEPNNPRWFVGLVFSFTFLIVLTWLCIKAAKALYDARRWGAYVAIFFGVLLLLFTGDFVYDMYHPEKQSADEYFGILIVPFTTAVGLWWCIYLNLPHVRARLTSNSVDG